MKPCPNESRPGALTKEFHYFTGPAKVESYLRNGGELAFLWAGKIGFEHLPIVADWIDQGWMDPSEWTFPWEDGP